MKIKFLPIVAFLAAVVLFSCEKNPQKEAEREANKEQREANSQGNMAESHADKAMDHAENAMEHQSLADMNAAMANVPVPTFDNVQASEYAKKIGNDVREFVNSEDYQNAGKYTDKINDDLNKLADKVSNGSITQAEADEILTYGKNLAASVGITVTTTTTSSTDDSSSSSN